MLPPQAVLALMGIDEVRWEAEGDLAILPRMRKPTSPKATEHHFGFNCQLIQQLQSTVLQAVQVPAQHFVQCHTDPTLCSAEHSTPASHDTSRTRIPAIAGNG